MSEAKRWVDHYLAQGYPKETLRGYLLRYGYSAEQADMLLGNKKKIDPNVDILHNSVSPSDAKEYFSRLFSLLQYPQVFFSHLQSVDKLLGFRMVCFSLLVGLSLGLLFWFGYWWSSSYLFIPEFMQGYMDIFYVIRIFVAFGLLFFVLQPAYYFVIRYGKRDLSYKQYLSAVNYAFVPFLLLGFIPIFNIFGILISLRFTYFALVKKLKVPNRSLVDLTVTYVGTILLISAALFYAASFSEAELRNPCTIYPEGACTVQQTAWNSLELLGVSEQVDVYNADDNLVCSGKQQLTCDSFLPPGAYYFQGLTVAGAFTLQP